MIIYVAVVWVYVRKVLIHRKSINYVYLVIPNVVHVVISVRIVVSVVNLDYFLFRMQPLVLNRVRRIIILDQFFNEIILCCCCFFYKIVNFENVFVVKLIVHHVKPILIFVPHVQLVMLSRIQIVLKQQKNVMLVNILILLKTGKSQESLFV